LNGCVVRLPIFWGQTEEPSLVVAGPFRGTKSSPMACQENPDPCQEKRHQICVHNFLSLLCSGTGGPFPSPGRAAGVSGDLPSAVAKIRGERSCPFTSTP